VRPAKRPVADPCDDRVVVSPADSIFNGHWPIDAQSEIEVKGVRNIHGRLYLDVIKKSDGSLEPMDGDTYQFARERGLVVIDSPVVGLVAILPIGMAQVSSVGLGRSSKPAPAEP
jgi:hypothetical protein